MIAKIDSGQELVELTGPGNSQQLVWDILEVNPNPAIASLAHPFDQQSEACTISARDPSQIQNEVRMREEKSEASLAGFGHSLELQGTADQVSALRNSSDIDVAHLIR